MIKAGDIVTTRAFDDVPAHLFEVHSIHEDCLTGIALSGPLAGEYGEPPIDLVLAGTSHFPAPH